MTCGMVVAVLLIAVLLYRFRLGGRVNVEPHARGEIEKAKQR
jgi:hypothetical protein